jgi:hypothetical protein
MSPSTERALNDISTERARQVVEEGYDRVHDLGHDDGALACAASCYALPRKYRIDFDVPLLWWPDGWVWKPTPNDRRRELVKAGALIVAEIERLDCVAALSAREAFHVR